MERFQALFGIAPDAIQKNVVIVPFLAPKTLELLGVSPLHNGMLYAAGQASSFTFIRARMGASFVADAVLYLKDTPCENILFFGSCGLTDPALNVTIGSLVTPASALAMESVSDLLFRQTSTVPPGEPDKDLLNNLRSQDANILPVACASFASLALEEDYLNVLRSLKAEIIEMECAALFHAAKHVGKKAAAVLFVSDVLGADERKFWKAPSEDDKKRLADGISQACLLIKNLFS